MIQVGLVPASEKVLASFFGGMEQTGSTCCCCVSACLAETQLYEVHRQERQLELCERRHNYQWSTSSSTSHPVSTSSTSSGHPVRGDSLVLPRRIQVGLQSFHLFVVLCCSYYQFAEQRSSVQGRQVVAEPLHLISPPSTDSCYSYYFSTFPLSYNNSHI